MPAACLQLLKTGTASAPFGTKTALFFNFILIGFFFPLPLRR
jgi:hypothetical protein